MHLSACPQEDAGQQSPWLERAGEECASRDLGWTEIWMLGCLSAQVSRVWTAGKERKCNRGRCLVSCVGGFLVWLIFLGGSGYRGPTCLSRASLLSGILAGAPFPPGLKSVLKPCV